MFESFVNISCQKNYFAFFIFSFIHISLIFQTQFTSATSLLKKEIYFVFTSFILFLLLFLFHSYCALTHSPRWKMIKHLSKRQEIEADILMETYKANTFFKTTSGEWIIFFSFLPSRVLLMSSVRSNKKKNIIFFLLNVCSGGNKERKFIIVIMKWSV